MVSVIVEYGNMSKSSVRSGADLVKVDLSDPAAITTFVEKYKPDFVVHSAAQR